MKKSLLVLVFVALIFSLTACGGGQDKISAAGAGYSCNAKITYGSEIKADAKLKVTGGGVFSATIISPKEFEGLTFNFDNEDMSLSYGDLKADKISIADDIYGFADLLNGIFLKLTTGSPTAVGSGDDYIYNGQSDLYRFSVTFNGDGFPKQISVPQAGLTVTLSDWQY